MDNPSKNVKEAVKTIVKDRMYDIIGVLLVLGVGFLSLGALGIKNLSLDTFLSILAEGIPYYLVSVTLSMNYYKKGAFVGKQSERFIGIAMKYSSTVNSFDGAKIEKLPSFCEYYNDKALKNIQNAILKSVSITYKQFNDWDGENAPLKILPYKTLKKKYGKIVADGVEKARRAKIKGINPNMLLSSLSCDDTTDIGLTESQLFKSRTLSFVCIQVASIVALTFLYVNQVEQWAWVGFFFVAFKLVYIFATSYLKYYSGKNDIENDLATYLSRKSDILKEFEPWYTENCNNNCEK